MIGPEERRLNPRTRFRTMLARWFEALRKLHHQRSEAEVFPWLEHSAAAVAVLGAVAAFILGRGIGGLILGAILGAIGGTWLAMSWASGATRRESNDPSILWDPWLDQTGEAEPEPQAIVLEEVMESEAAIFLGRARVRPRVFSPESGDALTLEDELGPILVAYEQGAVCISGPDGSGKSTALAHLARLVPPHLQVTFLDTPDPQDLAEASNQGLVVYTSCHGLAKPLGNFKLAPWDEDEWIEYLLSGDRSLCAPVMARLKGIGAERELLEGIPELWRIVLDRMSEDPAIEGPRQALRAEFDRIFTDPEFRELIEADCLEALTFRGNSHPRKLGCLRRHDPEESLFRLIRHQAVQLLMAADCMATDLAERRGSRGLDASLPRELVSEAGLRIAGRPEAIERLRGFLAVGYQSLQPMVASLLHAAGIGWKPGKPSPHLAGAYLEKASWAGVVLIDADLREVDLSRSDLWGSKFDRSNLEKARLVSADLRQASLDKTRFAYADLRGARLARARAERAGFKSAILVSADLEAAILERATFREADLRQARFMKARLAWATFADARLDGADFTGADLSGANLQGLKLALARFDRATFAKAVLCEADLEGMKLPNANFSGADFRKALLTGSIMPGANFRGAQFFSAGLAEVEWEGADLRGADFRRAAFHLGSSRSGLVGSTIASEGSRTGFYTDDYNDQDFKSPEQIRKADLRGVDLRGANIQGVDFYLVDLRGAKLDADQHAQLRQTGAILESRA
jgi:uncharacterized protein YjbI with pentapeptide repeats/energy-coupling factor transporter ATP-binding protein EcfA2